MSIATVECGARLFAKVHSEAHAIAPLLAQEFDITFKGSDEAVKLLNTAGVLSPSSQDNYPFLAGKTIRVKVEWVTLSYLTLRNAEGEPTFFCLLSEEEFKSLVKQIGLAPKMFNVWKIAKQHRLMQEQ